MYISEHILDLTNHFCRIFRKIASELNLTAEQAKLLLSIPFDGIPMTELATSLGIDVSTLTRNVQKLTVNNLIKIQYDNYDKRKKLVFLTNHGVEKTEKLENMLDSYSNNILETISVEERVTIQTTFEKLNWTLTCIRDNE